MRYLFLIYSNERAREALPQEERQITMNQAIEVMAEASRRGVFEGADPLHPTGSATTLRNQNGKVMITDGPFAETKEQLGGYIILNCKDLDEALEWAAKFPSACGGTGCIEIRPIREVPEFAKLRESSAASAIHG